MLPEDYCGVCRQPDPTCRCGQPCPTCGATYTTDCDCPEEGDMAEIRTWSIEDPGGIAAADYIIGATLGAWGSDEDSMVEACVVTFAGVLRQAGIPDREAAELAIRQFVPGEGEPERKVSISVTRDGDGYQVGFDFEEA